MPRIKLIFILLTYFFSLMPGESKFVVIETNAEKIIEKPVIVVKGWNVDRKQINK